MSWRDFARSAAEARERTVKFAIGFKDAYRSAFAAYLVDGDEAALQRAYELGREAVAYDVSLLDIGNLHHESLARALSRASNADETERVTRAAGEFLLEMLSPYEMVARGFVEARDAALFERRRAVMLRQLSSLLSDASLAADAAAQYEELLSLAADHARELTNARGCLVVMRDGMQIWSADEADDAFDHGAHPRQLSTSAWSRSEDAPVRFTGPEFQRPATRASVPRAETADPVRGWVAAPLTALDGTEYGWIHLVTKVDGDFTEADEAVLVHLAQMTAAAIERASIYESSQPPTKRRPSRQLR